MATWITPKEGAARFRTLGQLMEREVINALRRSTYAWRRNAFGIFSQRGLGRVFGDEAVLGNETQRASTKQARVVIKRERVRKVGDLYETGLRLRGFAALVEAGGRTKAHPINPQPGGVLAWQGPDGAVFARGVQHPGSQMPRDPFVEQAARASESEFKRQQEIAMERAAKLAKLDEAA